MTPAGRRATIVGGLATTAVGVLVAAQGPVDADRNGINENPFDDNWGAYMLGSVLVTGGLAMLAGGIASREVSDEPPLKPIYQPPAPAYATFAPPSFTVAPPRASLPEMAASAEQVRTAQQIRALAADGHCDAAWTMWHQLDAADHAYAVAVRDGTVMAPCPVRTAIAVPVSTPAP